MKKITLLLMVAIAAINMSAATIPVLLDELNREGKLHKGEKIVLSGFGAGLTYGACVLIWN